jgi:hypothetical protein
MIKMCLSENLQWLNFLVYHYTSAHSLEILLVHSRHTDLLHMKHVYDGVLFFDGGQSKFSRMLTHAIDESGQLTKVA